MPEEIKETQIPGNMNTDQMMAMYEMCGAGCHAQVRFIQPKVEVDQGVMKGTLAIELGYLRVDLDQLSWLKSIFNKMKWMEVREQENHGEILPTAHMASGPIQ